MVTLVARQIDDGAVANLGIGMRKRVATHLSAGKEVMLHSENVVIGEGPAAVLAWWELLRLYRPGCCSTASSRWPHRAR